MSVNWQYKGKTPFVWSAQLSTQQHLPSFCLHCRLYNHLLDLLLDENTNTTDETLFKFTRAYPVLLGILETYYDIEDFTYYMSREESLSMVPSLTKKNKW